MAADRDRLLARAARQAEDDPFFVGSALAEYRRLSSMDNTALAAFLDCDEAALSRLALCRRPEGEEPMFRDEVTRIAGYAGCNAARLASLLRAATTAGRMRAASPASLLAARDRPPHDAWTDQPSVASTPSQDDDAPDGEPEPSP